MQFLPKTPGYERSKDKHPRHPPPPELQAGGVDIRVKAGPGTHHKRGGGGSGASSLGVGRDGNGRAETFASILAHLHRQVRGNPAAVSWCIFALSSVAVCQMRILIFAYNVYLQYLYSSNGRLGRKAESSNSDRSIFYNNMFALVENVRTLQRQKSFDESSA